MYKATKPVWVQHTQGPTVQWELTEEPSTYIFCTFFNQELWPLFFPRTKETLKSQNKLEIYENEDYTITMYYMNYFQANFNILSSTTIPKQEKV